jgi:hypothetical protein
MQSRMSWGLTALGGLGGVAWAAVALSVPAPAGACSLVDPCYSLRQTIDAGDPVFESLGEVVELPDVVTVEFDGSGNPWTIQIGDRQIQVGEAE